jgi:uncharacterized membrane protein (UPF0127 family)
MWFSLIAGALVAFAALAVACGDAPAAAPSTVQTPSARQVTIQGDGHSETLNVEVAATPPERQQGLMFRQELDDSAGMLFLFPADDSVGFWMKNTYIPLTIAFIDSSGRVVELRDGRPLDETVLTPAHPYRYALEVNQGWFERHGLGVGARLTLPVNLPAAR